jgi:DNA polymerase
MDVTDGAATTRALQFLAEQADTCERCPLFTSRTRAVFGAGNQAADVMVVGMAPGRDEDAAGIPFVGDAGKKLDALLEGAGFRRDDLYITNVVKCHPPGNRPLGPEEVSACAPFLDLQLALVKPRVVIAVGADAATRLTGAPARMEDVHGEPRRVGQHTVVPTFHPSSFKWDNSRQALAVEDLRAADRALGEPPSP